MTITTAQGGKLRVRPRVGGLQGDAVMPEMFGETCDEAVEGWIRERLDWTRA